MGEKIRFRRKCGAVLLVLSFPMSSAVARNVAVMLPIEQAMKAPAAADRLDGSVRLYFGTSPAHPIARDFGTYVARRKTNGFAKSEETSCDWAFLAAVRELQERAIKLGGNAVIDIESYYDRHPVSSRTDFECHKGFLMAGVTLRGKVVRFAGR